MIREPSASRITQTIVAGPPEPRSATFPVAASTLPVQGRASTPAQTGVAFSTCDGAERTGRRWTPLVWSWGNAKYYIESTYSRKTRILDRCRTAFGPEISSRAAGRRREG